jgi:hypothetical protein
VWRKLTVWVNVLMRRWWGISKWAVSDAPLQKGSRRQAFTRRERESEDALQAACQCMT